MLAANRSLCAMAWRPLRVATALDHWRQITDGMATQRSRHQLEQFALASECCTAEGGVENVRHVKFAADGELEVSNPDVRPTAPTVGTYIRAAPHGGRQHALSCMRATQIDQSTALRRERPPSTRRPPCPNADLDDA